MRSFHSRAKIDNLLFAGGEILLLGSALGLLASRLTLRPRYAVMLSAQPIRDWIPTGGLLLIAMGLAAYRTRRFRMTIVPCGLVAALCIMGLIDYAMGPGSDLQRLRLPATALDRWLSSERMTPLTALVFLYLSAGCIVSSLAKTGRIRRVILATAGYIAIAASVFGASGEVASTFGLSGFNRFQGLGVGAALGSLGAGIALIGLALGQPAQSDASERTSEAQDAAPVIGLVLATLLSLTLFAFQWAQAGLQDRIREKFEVATKDIVDDIGDRMPTYAMALRGSAQFLERTGRVSRDDWHRYVASLQVTTTFPGIMGIGYLAYVPGERLREHVDVSRRLWSASYRVYPGGRRAAYAPVVLLDPDTERARQVIGFDHFSETTRRSAITQVRDSGQPAISGSVTLVLDQGKSRLFGFLMYMPVYRKGMPAESAIQRRAALAGIVFSPFRFDELMRGILADRYQGVRVRKLDGDPGDAARLVFDENHVADGSVWRTVPLDAIPVGAIILGRRWTVVTTPLEAFIAGEPRTGAWILLAGGTVISVLFAAAIWQLFAIQARARSLAAAEALTRETENRLRAEQALQAEREQARLRVEALNRELVQRASELEIANRELETFSYSVSHDLKQPVSAIAGFSSIVLEDFGKDLHSDVREFLTRIRAASFRMSQLIDGLLALSSISRAELHFEAVDLSQLARETLAELRGAQPDREIDVRIQEGLVAQGDPKLLQVLVNNLLGNAWKYTGKQPQPRIEMGVAETAKGRAYFVRDNGAGFDMAGAEKLFSAFHRLHAASEFPGTGIGLATVHRIVTRHGGQIWAEAEPGRGARFFFTLAPPSPGSAA